MPFTRNGPKLPFAHPLVRCGAARYFGLSRQKQNGAASALVVCGQARPYEFLKQRALFLGRATVAKISKEGSRYSYANFGVSDMPPSRKHAIWPQVRQSAPHSAHL